MNLKIKLVFITMLLFSAINYAQESVTVNGNVTSKTDNEPILGANIIIEGTTKGISTDFDGNYKIKVKQGDVLQFSYLGFKTKSITFINQKTINVALEEDSNVLDEIVIVGYGSQKQKNLTNAVSKVSGDVLGKSITPRIDDALRGRVAGVNITTANTEAGGDTRITIRGAGSISGTSAPLIVVDGVPIGTDPDLLSSIDSNNIESIEVLKDASSTAIYGSRGANGVIIVTLKSGVAGDTKFSYNTYTGYRWAKKNNNFNLSIGEEESRIDRLFANVNLSDATQLQLEDFNDDYLTAKSELTAQKYIAAANGGETDWQDVVFSGGQVTSHSFSARGGSELSKFDASISYIKDEGVFLVDQFERYNARLKVSSQTKNKTIKYGATVNVRFIDQDRLPVSFIDPIRQTSWLPEYLNKGTLAYVNPYPNADGSNLNADNTVIGSTYIDVNDLTVGSIPLESAFNGYFQADGNGGIVVDQNGSPVPHPTYEGLTISSTNNNGPRSFLDLRARTKDQFTGFGSSYIEFKLAKGLKFKQSIAGNYRTTRNTRYISYLSDEDQSLESRRADEVSTRLQLNVESLLTYKKSFGKHNVNALAGFTFDKFNYTLISLDVQGVFADDFTSNISLADASNSPETFTFLGEEKLISYFGRVIYDYDDKYLFTVSARTDGSSRFGIDNRFGVFSTASLGWNISEENFLKESNIISNLKLRASYGISGSNAIDSDIFNSLYRSLALASTVQVDGATGRKVTNLGDPTLGWEQLVETNLGVDFGFFNGSINGSVDYYDKKSEDLILDLQVPSVIGSNNQLQNIGQVKNSGIEVQLDSRVIRKENFSWSVSGQISANRNEVLNLGGAQQIVTSLSDANRPVQWITEVGGPISAFYGYVQDTSKEIPAYEFTESGNGVFDRYDLESQSVFVVDINGDGIIDEDDRTVLGSPYPDFEWGFVSSIDIYDFDFNFALNGSHGAERRVGDIGTIRNSDFSSGLINGSFTDNNLTAPRNLTSAHIQDASFVALRNVSLGYTIPNEYINKYGLSKVRLYATGEHLLYFFADGYEGFNPEAAGTTSSGANTPITYGYQRGDGPISKTISFGLNIDF
ncbi:SusC/RagA family TonB-linked outer membrane protein [Polaribacter sp. Hel1_85]|uniref:SusC/RagA family TonB-linked outer membrane protein n=1 Tax=Polaribacter sp. Hel1_85 TaxID=1250005 RepID=UPI00052C9F7A|nr:SusC/RagA family TonB-linked outer membrane protein [Polaribacter sp. Hel1_85]KGL61796.1 TonB-dependent receptor, plug [Polaribacter sp. Hel1_85]